MYGLFEGSVTNWMLIVLASFIIGFSKAGVKGTDMMNITIMAIVFGAKTSTGIVLPLLCLADFMAVCYYHRHARWEHYWKLLPWMIAGILVGVFVGNDLDEAVFRKVMAFIIILTVVIMLLLEFRKSFSVPQNRFFVAIMGLTSGVTTMLGNLAGAFSNIYFLSMRMVKNDFIGTAASLFLAINLFKIPFQVFYWKNITLTTLYVDLWLLPALLIGFYCGIRIVARIRDNKYRKVVIALTLVGAVFIFFK